MSSKHIMSPKHLFAHFTLYAGLLLVNTLVVNKKKKNTGSWASGPQITVL